jgi:hypothetical protein
VPGNLVDAFEPLQVYARRRLLAHRDVVPGDELADQAVGRPIGKTQALVGAVEHSVDIRPDQDRPNGIGYRPQWLSQDHSER